MSKIGVIGGSGLYNIEGIKDVKEVAVQTPFGPLAATVSSLPFERSIDPSLPHLSRTSA